MVKPRNKLVSHFRLDTKLARKLDTRITRAGYTNRSDFFTAVAYVALYGENAEKEAQERGENTIVQTIPETVASWVKTTLPKLSEEQIQRELKSVIHDILFAVIAMKGVEVAYENTWETVREVFHDRTNIWVTESDIREAFETFAVINRCSLDRYREEQLGRRNE